MQTNTARLFYTYKYIFFQNRPILHQLFYNLLFLQQYVVSIFPNL